MTRKLILVTLALTATAALGFQVVRQAAHPRTIPSALAAITPQGALLTIESPDFAALLRSWNQSSQQKAWLASDNYSVFSNSRLLGRLSDASAQFESALPKRKEDIAIDAGFLTQIAGRQSLFAWYDVGNLEFLYITRMPSTQAARVALLQSHAGWTPRQAAGATFYLRKSTSEGTPRTVAYAQLPTAAGDTLVLLATREDLLAQSLALLQTPGAAVSRPSVDQEPWYKDALAAQPPNLLSFRSAAEGSAFALSSAPPVLHMVLNLDRLVPLPAFHTYWVQQNITQMKQYRSAVSDLYTTAAEFREERTLLLKSPSGQPATPILFELAQSVPTNSGVYRATATQSPAVAIAALEEKLLGRATLEKLTDKDAPDPSLSAPTSGNSADLETRIDTPAPVSTTFSNQALTDTLKAASLDAILTYSTAVAPATPGSLWIPIHNAVLLHAATPWNSAALQSAVQQSLRGQLTTSTLGIEFRHIPGANENVFALTGPKHLYLFTVRNLAVLTDDQKLLENIRGKATSGDFNRPPATQLAGFDHTSQRAPYARLTALIDGNNQQTSGPSADSPTDTGTDIGTNTSDAGTTPAFFSRNMKSLSDSFSTLLSQRFLETPIDTPSGPALHQTVTYQWRP